MSGYVYFIRPMGKAGPIKIGHSTFPPTRLITMQIWSYEELEIISQFAAPRKMEKDLHERFARYQIRGEWFLACDELVALAEGIRYGKSISDLVDLSVKTGKLFRRNSIRSPEAEVVGAYKRRVVYAAKYAYGQHRGRGSVPKKIQKILESAGGYQVPYRFLSEAETAEIEAFIAKCRAPINHRTTALDEVAAKEIAA